MKIAAAANASSISPLLVNTLSHLAMEGAYSILVLTSKTGQSSIAATALDSPEDQCESQVLLPGTGALTMK
jgi:hypothetical protein